jgi:hypothetical protein
MVVKYLGDNEYEGLTADTKPANAPVGARYNDTQTKKVFFHAGAGVYVELSTTVDTSEIRDDSNNLIASVVNPNFTFEDAKNIVVGTATGTKIATSGTQKLGFFGATPIAQPVANPDTSGTTTVGQLETEVNELKQLLRNLGLLAT